MWWNAAAVSDRMEYVDPFSPTMMVLAVLAIVTLLEATRRAVEPGLAWMVIISIAYMQFGHLLPGVLNTRVFTPAEILEASWLVPTAGGVYGPLTGIVATTIAAFIVFGSFMAGIGHGAAVLQPRRRGGGALLGRAGEGGRRHLRPVRDDERLVRVQRHHHRRHDHPADEAHRLQAGGRGRDRVARPPSAAR